ncbi:uncharacterized protein DS421_19g658220 [Arachis hypogaea]|uniref:Uncharacterized protein n=1 Tax=Arachis hypogaea TaxID=3818 RepID=A0A6B9V9A3_ARAHY|nr:uncharacterized protein DS421_19g658220 [Arachis hypogaea]
MLSPLFAQKRVEEIAAVCELEELVLADLLPLGSRTGNTRDGWCAVGATSSCPSLSLPRWRARGRELAVGEGSSAVVPCEAIPTVPATVNATEAPTVIVVEGARRSCWRLPPLYLVLRGCHGRNSSPLLLEVAAGLPLNRFEDRHYSGSAVPPSIRVVETVAKVAWS